MSSVRDLQELLSETGTILGSKNFDFNFSNSSFFHESSINIISILQHCFASKFIKHAQALCLLIHQKQKSQSSIIKPSSENPTCRDTIMIAWSAALTTLIDDASQLFWKIFFHSSTSWKSYFLIHFSAPAGWWSGVQEPFENHQKWILFFWGKQMEREKNWNHLKTQCLD